VCPWPFLAPLEMAAPTKPTKTFAQAVAKDDDSPVTHLPPRVVIGDTVRIKLSQDWYVAGFKDCTTHLHGRVTLQRNDAPLTTQTLRNKLSSLWSDLKNWSVTPLGRGCFEFEFNSIEDMRKVLAQSVLNLKPRILRFFSWMADFNTQSHQQTHAQIWVRLMHLPQEYWRKQTLFEIASGVGNPLIIDEATKSRLFGIYARVLVDVDMSGKLFESVLVKREGFAFPVEIQYERKPLFCSHCKCIGHSIQQCKKLGVRGGTEATTHVARKATKTQVNQIIPDMVQDNNGRASIVFDSLPKITQANNVVSADPINHNSQVVAPDIPDMPQCDEIVSEIIVTHTNVVHSKERRVVAALFVNFVPEAQDGLDD